MKALLENNSQDTLIRLYGSLHTFEVSTIECYPVHFDPIGIYIYRDTQSCDVHVLFKDPELKITEFPKYAIIQPEGPNDIGLHMKCWDIAEDPLKVPGCIMCLVKFLDGSPVAVRYNRKDVFKVIYTPIKDL